jgi:hypothetical protein
MNYKKKFSVNIKINWLVGLNIEIYIYIDIRSHAIQC